MTFICSICTLYIIIIYWQSGPPTPDNYLLGKQKGQKWPHTSFYFLEMENYWDLFLLFSFSFSLFFITYKEMEKEKNSMTKNCLNSFKFSPYLNYSVNDSGYKMIILIPQKYELVRWGISLVQCSGSPVSKWVLRTICVG